jgi:hypothetical protein
VKIIEAFSPRRGTPVPPGVGFSLSIDPGATTGWALFSSATITAPKRLVACGTGHPPYEGVLHLVIEVPQIYPGKGHVRPQDLVTLAFLAGRLAGCSGVLDTRYCFPHEWKGTLPKEICHARVMKKLSTEEREVIGASEKIISAGLMHNVLDAVGIGLYAWRKS